MTRSRLHATCALAMLMGTPFALIAASPMRSAQADDTAVATGTEAVRVRLDAPAGCSDGARFLREVMARTPRVRAAEGDEAGRVFRVSIAAQGGAMRGTLIVEETRHASKPRWVRGATCDEVASALALIAALAVDPQAKMIAPAVGPTSPDALDPLPSASATAQASEPDAALIGDDASAPAARPDASTAPAAASARSPAPPPKSAPEPSAPEPPPSDDGAAFRWSFTGGAMFDVVGAAAPGAVPGGRLFFDVAREGGSAFRPSVRMAAAHDGETSVTTDAGAVRLAWTTFDLDLCPWALHVASIALKPCAAIDVGVLSASASGLVSNAQSRVRPWVAAGVSALFEWRFGRFLVAEAQGGLRAPITRDTFIFQADFPVYTTPRILLELGLGLGVRFR